MTTRPELRGRLPRRHRRLALVLALALSLSVAGGACGGSSDDAGPDPADGDPADSTPGGSADPGAPTGEPGIGDETFPALGNDDIDVTHYELDLGWDPATATLTATAAVDLLARTDLAEVSLDFGPLPVTAVTTGTPEAPAAAEHRQGDGKLVVTLDEPLAAGDGVRVTVSYGGTPEPIQSAAPIPIGWLQLGEGTVATLSEPDAAHTFFPCNDHPLDKATFRTTVRVPEGLTAVSNGVLAGESVEAGTAAFTWAMDQPMAPYLLLVAIDDFAVREQGTTAGVPLRNYLPPGEESLFSGGLGNQPTMLQFLVDRLGPFPFTEYGAVVVPGGPIALETQGRSVFQGPSARDRATVVHELAHQWFGNSVSITEWQRDIWWVEGFARFSEWLWAERSSGRGEYLAQAELAHSGLQFGEWTGLGAIGPGELFTPTVYDGGALVFYDLRARLGDDVFFAALRAFAERFRHGNATTDDLVAVFGEVAGQDLRPVFDPWLAGGALPALTFE